MSMEVKYLSGNLCLKEKKNFHNSEEKRKISTYQKTFVQGKKLFLLLSTYPIIL